MSATENLSEEEKALLSAVSKRKQDVQLLLSEGHHAQALQKALSNPPIESKVSSTKDANADIVRSVLMTIPDKNIDDMIQSLSQIECDILMKFLYKLLADKTGAGGAMLLKWHGKLVAVTGIGSIIRVMTDRRVV